MKIELHPHAMQRISERKVTEKEVMETVTRGERFPAKFGRTGFRFNFNYNGTWRGKKYSVKQIEAYAVKEDDRWLVITVMSKFF